ncbi:MAG TPA: protein-disulfide reductase DsbD domain-containing protein, partial [Thermomonas sp.]
MTGLTLRLRRWLAAQALIAGLLAALPAAAADVELPPVDQVFVLSAQATARDRIEVRWKIADGYYLYRHRTSVKTSAAFANPTLALPAGDKHRDEFFGDVETYRQQLVGVVRGMPAADAAGVALTVKYQGCADAGVCYPPQTRTLTVALPPAAGGADTGFLPGRQGGGLFGLGGADAGSVDAAPLPAEQAFTSELIALDGNTLLLRLTPARGYYLYRDKLTVALAERGLSTALPPPAALPRATPHRDEHFGDVAVYFDEVEIPLPVTRTATAATRTTLVLGLQGCQTDGICYPPMTRRLAVALPAGKVGTPTSAPVTAPPAPTSTATAAPA